MSEFDITKLCYKQGHDVSSEPPIGSEGYFADSLAWMYTVVTSQDKDYYGMLTKIKKDVEGEVYGYPFIHQSGLHYAYFYPVKKGPSYRPYTWEDVPGLMDKIYVNKSFRLRARANSFREKEGQLYINGIAALIFLREYEWEDGTPCGVLIEEGGISSII